MIGMMMQDADCKHFIERQLEIWYPWLTFVDEKGYDHVDQDGADMIRNVSPRVDVSLHHQT